MRTRNLFHKIYRLSVAAAVCQILWLLPAMANDYPTEARAEYVVACLSHNAENGAALRQCACTIDKIASRLTYDEYVAAETVLRMRQLNGEKGSLFRESDSFGKTIATLKNAEAEAKNVCFQ
ncbi:MAG: hypothetical protein HQ511_03300 [Rhodospirillales bacterium]|nr:hypothetical protein [Rhodospirillales bacterium]